MLERQSRLDRVLLGSAPYPAAGARRGARYRSPPRRDPGPTGPPVRPCPLPPPPPAAAGLTVGHLGAVTGLEAAASRRPHRAAAVSLQDSEGRVPAPPRSPRPPPVPRPHARPPGCSERGGGTHRTAPGAWGAGGAVAPSLPRRPPGTLGVISEERACFNPKRPPFPDVLLPRGPCLRPQAPAPLLPCRRSSWRWGWWARSSSVPAGDSSFLPAPSRAPGGSRCI